MVGAVVNQSDCTTSANDTLSTPGVMSTLPGVMSTLPGVYDFSTLSTSHSSDVIVTDDVTACKLGVATATTLLAGLYQVLLGVLGLGCVTQYMPAPVMRGFVTGSAVHVAASQLQNAFGIRVTGYTGNFKVVLVSRSRSRLQYTHVVGCVSLAQV
jgi:MFS superfamily sulfate permease-like transporter